MTGAEELSSISGNMNMGLLPAAAFTKFARSVTEGGGAFTGAEERSSMSGNSIGLPAAIAEPAPSRVLLRWKVLFAVRSLGCSILDCLDRTPLLPVSAAFSLSGVSKW